MQLLAPDILNEVRQLSAPLLAAGILTGLVLWLTGWWGHRFWIVLIATVGAGVGGLVVARPDRSSSVMAGLLLAMAAGLLALALVRVLAFIAGGCAALVAVRALAPGWDEPFLTFLGGGLAGLLLFRVWTMVLTSFAGSLLVLYFGLSLADSLGKLDGVGFATQRVTLANALCAAATLAGTIVQFILDRRHQRAIRRRDERDAEQLARWSRRLDRRGWIWGLTDYRRAS